MASQEELKAIKELTQSIGKEMDSLSEKSDKRNKKLLAEADAVKSIASELSSQKEAQNAIIDLQQRINNLSGKNLGVNEGMKDSLQDQMEAAKSAFNIRKNEFKVTEKVASAVDRTTDSLENGVASLSSQIKQVPVLGKLIAKPLDAMKGSFSKVGGIFKEKVTNEFFKARAQGLSTNKSISKAMKGGFKEIGGLARVLFNPYVALGAIIAATFGAGLVAMYKLVKQARVFREDTGLTRSQTEGIQNDIFEAYGNTKFLGASLSEITKTASAFSQEFGNIERASIQTLTSITVMSKNFGVQVRDAVKVNKIFQNMGGASQEIAASQQESLVSLANQAGVAPRQIMADIAESAEEASVFFRGNQMALGAAAINAAKMGSSLKEAVRVSKGLLDYQSSVSSEMEASAILQTNLNFSQSRFLAASGKPAQAQAKMVEQLRKTVNLSQLNNYEAAALEKATGMTLGEMRNMARLQEMNVGLTDAQNKLMSDAFKLGLDISGLSDDQIRAKTAELAKQKEMQDVFQQMQDKLHAIGSTILFAFLPLGKILMNAMNSIEKADFSYFTSTFELVKDVVVGIWPIIKTAMKTLFEGAQSFYKSMKPGIDAIRASLQPIIETIGKVFDENGKSGKFIKTLKSIFTFVSGVIGGVISIAFKAIARQVEAIGNVFGSIVSLLSGEITFGKAISQIGEGLLSLVMALPITLYDAFKSIFTSLGGYIANMIRGVIGDTAANYIGLPQMAEGGVLTKATAVVAGEAGPEAIIPLDKYNFGGESMGGVINELRELKAAFISNKDVYIDNEKITSRITKTQEKSNINQFGLLGA
jgi:hypothetical protein